MSKMSDLALRIQEAKEEMIEKIKLDIMRYEADCSLSIAEGDEMCKRCTETVFGSILRIIDRNSKEVDGCQSAEAVERK